MLCNSYLNGVGLNFYAKVTSFQITRKFVKLFMDLQIRKDKHLGQKCFGTTVFIKGVYQICTYVRNNQLSVKTNLQKVSALLLIIYYLQPFQNNKWFIFCSDLRFKLLKCLYSMLYISFSCTSEATHQFNDCITVISWILMSHKWQ